MKEHIGLMPKTSREVSASGGDVDEQLDVLTQFSEIIESGQVEEFIIIGIDEHKQMVMASYYNDTITGIGLLEMGKYALMSKHIGSEE